MYTLIDVSFPIKNILLPQTLYVRKFREEDFKKGQRILEKSGNFFSGLEKDVFESKPGNFLMLLLFNESCP